MSTVLAPETIHPPRNLSRIAPAAACAIAGAVLFHLGQSLLPTIPEHLPQAYAAMLEHRDRLMAARLATSAGAFLLAPAAVGFARLIPRGARGAGLLAFAATLFGIATFCNALSQAVSGYAAWAATAPGFDPASGRTVVDTVECGLVALPLGFWSIPAFALGALLMAVVAGIYLGRADRLPVVEGVGHAGLWVALAVWAVVFTAMLVHVTSTVLRPGRL